VGELVKEQVEPQTSQKDRNIINRLEIEYSAIKKAGRIKMLKRYESIFNNKEGYFMMLKRIFKEVIVAEPASSLIPRNTTGDEEDPLNAYVNTIDSLLFLTLEPKFGKKIYASTPQQVQTTLRRYWPWHSYYPLIITRCHSGSRNSPSRQRRERKGFLPVK
jgi:hypothetical protein